MIFCLGIVTEILRKKIARKIFSNNCIRIYSNSDIKKKNNNFTEKSRTYYFFWNIRWKKLNFFNLLGRLFSISYAVCSISFSITGISTSARERLCFISPRLFCKLANKKSLQRKKKVINVLKKMSHQNHGSTFIKSSSQKFIFLIVQKYIKYLYNRN